MPPELPGGSRKLPTSHTRPQDPASATRHLDFVFASGAIADHVTVRARKAVEASVRLLRSPTGT